MAPKLKTDPPADGTKNKNLLFFSYFCHILYDIIIDMYL